MKNKFKGVLFSILFGLVGTIPWIIISHFGWVVSLAGYLIGLAAYTGYVKGNGSFDRVGKICLVIVILITIPFAELVNIFIAGLLEGLNFIQVALVLPYFIRWDIDHIAQNILLGYFMAALGTYRFFIPRRNKIPVEPIQNIN